MTNEEAIEILQEERDWAQQLSYVNKALETAMDALEKQIPKKPKNIGGELFCPVCKRHLFHSWDIKYCKPKDNHCFICGQALDWSEEYDRA